MGVGVGVLSFSRSGKDKDKDKDKQPKDWGYVVGVMIQPMGVDTTRDQQPSLVVWVN